ncbi:DUF4157 domain-containing protein [Streptomyces anulatus]
MSDRESLKKAAAESGSGRVAAQTPEVLPGVQQPAGRLLAQQATVGNAAVLQMLRRADQAPAQAQEGHQHGAGPEQPSAQRSAVHDVLRDSGKPLDGGTRTDMEARLGADFADVRIHDDAAARASAAEVGARAYTSGNHVVIGDGGNDRHTLAHELTHVIQQRQGPVSGTDSGSGLRVSEPSDRFERAAEANARRVMSAPVSGRESQVPASEEATAGVVGDVVQRAVHGTGSDQYTTEQFAHGNESRERVVRAEVIVVRPAARGNTPPPASFLSRQGVLDPDVGWQRGHVVALEVGGANESFNIVPMKPGFNHGGAWRGVERAVRNAAKDAGAGKLKFTVILRYYQADQRVPSAIECHLDEDTGNGPVPYDVPGVLPGGRVVLEHKAAATPAADAQETEALLGLPDSPKDLLSTLAGWVADPRQAEAALADNRMPNASKAQWPDDRASRPYENLDLQTFAGALPAVSMSSGEVFSAQQRTYILKANMARNNGTLMSDDPLDPHQVLNEDGTADYPEIDHIIPKSAGGSNAYSNARVVSWELNNKLDRVKSINQLVDPMRLELPATNDLSERVWHMVLRIEASGNGATDSAIRERLSQEYNEDPMSRGFKTRVQNAIKGLVEASCLVDKGQHEFGIGPRDPKDRDPARAGETG